MAVICFVMVSIVLLQLAASSSSPGENSHSLYYDQSKERFQLIDDHEVYQDLQLTKDQVTPDNHYTLNQLVYTNRNILPFFVRLLSNCKRPLSRTVNFIYYIN